jgi:hypothetical protein
MLCLMLKRSPWLGAGHWRLMRPRCRGWAWMYDLPVSCSPTSGPSAWCAGSALRAVTFEGSWMRRLAVAEARAAYWRAARDLADLRSVDGGHIDCPEADDAFARCVAADDALAELEAEP